MEIFPNFFRKEDPWQKKCCLATKVSQQFSKLLSAISGKLLDTKEIYLGELQTFRER
jgi:hypothetical protein